MKNDDERKIEKSNENIENKIFHNNKFSYKKFEKFVDKSKSFIFLEIDIKNAINGDNCTEDNLALIKAFKDAAGSRGNTISLFVALASFGISTLSLANNSIQVTGNDIKIFDIIAFLIVVIVGYGVYYVCTKKAEKLQFAYSYLTNMMEIKLEESNFKKLKKECNYIEAEETMAKIENQELVKEIAKEKEFEKIKLELALIADYSQFLCYIKNN